MFRLDSGWLLPDTEFSPTTEGGKLVHVILFLVKLL